MNPLKCNIIFSAHISPAPLLIIWLNMCLSGFSVYWSDQDEFIFLVVNRRWCIWGSCAVTCLLIWEEKTKQWQLFGISTAHVLSPSPLWFHLEQCKMVVISVNQQAWSEHKFRNYVLLSAISSATDVSACSLPGQLVWKQIFPFGVCWFWLG